MIRKTEIKLSLSVHRVVEIREDEVDIAGESASLVSLLVDWVRARISRLFRAKIRDVLLQNSIAVKDSLMK